MAQTQRKQARSKKQDYSKHPNQDAYLRDARYEEIAVQAPVLKKAPPLQALNDTQKRYINAIKNFDLTFGMGCAGTGKTYIAGALACEMLSAKDVEKIIITRPAVDAGESLGFLPGDLGEKYEPYLAPLRSTLDACLGKSFVEYLIKTEKIQALPLAYMRGMTFDNCFVILDEAQNVTPAQMKMFLTRIGQNCKVVIDGDIEQKDIVGKSGLQDAIERISYIPSVKVVEFTDDDVVRSGIVGEIIRAYRRDPILAV